MGPRPTTRTNTKAHTNSGMLRNTMRVTRTQPRKTAGQRFMRPDKADRDNTRVATRLNGTARTKASVMPAVAMATVRHVSRTTMRMNSVS